MLKQHKRPLSMLFRLLDLSIIVLSFYAAYRLRFGTEGSRIYAAPIQFPVFFFAYLIAWAYLSNRFQLYGSKRLNRFSREVWDVARTTGLCLVIAGMPAFFIRHMPLSRLFLLYLWPLQTGSLIALRFLVRKVLRYIRRRGYNFRHVLIVGCNSRAVQVVKNIQETPEYGLRVMGFVDAPNGPYGPAPMGLDLLGRLDDLEGIVREQVVDEVFITLPVKTFYSEIETILRTCEKVGIEAKIPTDFFSTTLAKSTITSFAGLPIIGLYTSPRMNWQLMVKRLIDLTGSAVLLILLAPLFLIISIVIKYTSKGPVFFKQERVGYNGRVFTCLKFRSMLEHAEALRAHLTGLNELSGPVFKIHDDPRITAVGSILRKRSLDELPQLWNVFKGDMSLVGPRPPIPGEVSQYDLGDRRRLSMKPGITCLWQINGRSSLPFEKWMELDRHYIDNWSLWLDLKILVKTIPAVLKGSGAA
jgi:exopolysaccharide biosynthesis polyprenyl glycosylphosphotransferase